MKKVLCLVYNYQNSEKKRKLSEKLFSIICFILIRYFSFNSDIPNDENITLDIYVYAYGSGYNSRGTFNLSSDKVYKIPFEMNTYIIYTGIEITYPDIPLSGSVYICEMEVKG